MKFRLVIKDICGDLYYGRSTMVDIGEYKRTEEFLNNIKTLKYLTLIDADGNDIVFDPTKIICVKLEKLDA